MKKLLSAVAVLLVSTSASYAITIEGGAGGWKENPTGWIEYKKDNVSGTGVSATTHVDLKSDLHFSSKTRPEGWFAIKGIPILPDVKVQYTKMKFTGSGTPSVNFTFGDITVNATDKVDAEFRANQVDITLTYGVPFVKALTAGKIDLNWGVNVKVIDGYAKVVAVSPITNDKKSESKSATIPVPMVHLDGAIKPVEKLGLEFSGNWIGYSGSQFYDLTGEFKIYPVKRLFVGVGYRYQRLKIDDISDISSDIKIKGAFAEAGFTF